MGIFQKINLEKKELIHFSTLIREVAEQEAISSSQVCAVLAREIADHIGDIPFSFYSPFYPYKYDVVDGFRRYESFSHESLKFLKSMARGYQYEEHPNPALEGWYACVEDESDAYQEFFFKGSEVTMSFLDMGEKLPPCLEDFRVAAEKKLKRRDEELKVKTEKTISIDTLRNEISLLNEKLAQVTKKVPQKLGAYRGDDPLEIAINLRNVEWSSFDEDDARATTPSAEYLVAKLKSEYGMSGALAAAIEKVACPILRR